MIGVSHWDFGGDYVNLSVGHVTAVTLNFLNSDVISTEHFRFLTPNGKKPNLVLMISDFCLMADKKKKCTCTVERGKLCVPLAQFNPSGILSVRTN